MKPQFHMFYFISNLNCIMHLLAKIAEVCSTEKIESPRVK